MGKPDWKKNRPRPQSVPTRPPPQPTPQIKHSLAPVPERVLEPGWVEGTIKVFHIERSYGFAAVPGHKDVFVHIGMVKRCGVDPHQLTDDRSVQLKIGEGRRGNREAIEIKLL